MRITLAAVAMLSLLNHAACSAPVTLAFDAKVEHIAESGNFSLPFRVSVGDVIHGSFTFEPGPLGQSYAQSLGMTVSLPSANLHLQTYQISVNRNEFPPITYDANLQPVVSTPIDDIAVGCSLFGTGTQCSSGTVTGVPAVEWQPFLSIGGDSPILDNYDVPDDVSIWNQFASRGISLSFQPALGTGLVLVDASVEVFTAVPEPTTSVSAIALIACNFYRRSR